MTRFRRASRGGGIVGGRYAGPDARPDKRYGKRIVAVENLNLTVTRGEVYGFLGQNGAGKTTTLRMLLGLIRPSSDTVTVLGEDPGAPAGLARVGALVESPAFYPYLSGRDNLRVMARYAGAPRSRYRVKPSLFGTGWTLRPFSPLD